MRDQYYTNGDSLQSYGEFHKIMVCKIVMFLMISAVYYSGVENQRQEIEEIQKDEALELPEDLDYEGYESTLVHFMSE